MGHGSVSAGPPFTKKPVPYERPVAEASVNQAEGAYRTFLSGTTELVGGLVLGAIPALCNRKRHQIPLHLAPVEGSRLMAIRALQTGKFRTGLALYPLAACLVPSIRKSRSRLPNSRVVRPSTDSAASGENPHPSKSTKVGPPEARPLIFRLSSSGVGSSLTVLRSSQSSDVGDGGCYYAHHYEHSQKEYASC